MHEIEDLVHSSILVLDAHHPAGDDRLRDWLVTLYAFQNTYDCSYTMGRVEEILLRRRHTYRFPLRDHPDYSARRAYFDGLTGFTELGEGGDEGWGDVLTDGYADPPWLYCEAGSALWRRLADRGSLTGADAVAPRPVPLIDVVLAVAAAAERDGDKELIAFWWGLGPGALVDGLPLDAHDLAAIPAVVSLREIVSRTGAAWLPLPDGYRPTEPELDAMEDDRETWWYRVAE